MTTDPHAAPKDSLSPTSQSVDGAKDEAGDAKHAKKQNKIIMAMNGRQLTWAAHKSGPSKHLHRVLKIFPIIIKQEKILVNGGTMVVQTAMLEKAQGVDKDKRMLEAYKFPRQTLSEPGVHGSQLSTLDDLTCIWNIVKAMLTGMARWLIDEFGTLAMHVIDFCHDVERGHVGEQGVRDIPCLLVPVLVTTTVRDVGERDLEAQPFRTFDRVDACGRKWMQLWRHQVDGMEEAQFDPPAGRRLTLKAFRVVDKAEKPF